MINIDQITGRYLFLVTFVATDIAKFNQKLNSNKVHLHDNISIQMLKAYDRTRFFKNCFQKCSP